NALTEYKTLPNRMASGSEAAKRYVAYRIAMLKATVGEADAMDALTDFLKKNPNCWEYSSVAKQLAALQLNRGQFEEAAKTIEALARTDGLSKELKQQADLLLIDIQFQAGKLADVSTKVKGALAVMAPDDPERPKLEIYQIGCDAREGSIQDTVKRL